eukprot:598360-Ditylum_brightwellii.AAC.1
MATPVLEKATNFKESAYNDPIEAVIWRDVARHHAKCSWTTASRNTASGSQLLADLITAEDDCEGAVMGGTYDQQAWLWEQWEQWFNLVEIVNNIFLKDFSRQQTGRLFGAFAMAVHGGRYSSKPFDTLTEGSVRNTIQTVAATFKNSDRPSPIKDKDDDLSRLLLHQFRVLRNANPLQKQQKVLLICILSK